MTKILNGFFSILKYILLIISFMLTFYIILSMYERLEKSVVEALPIFIPYLILFLLMSFNAIFRQEQVSKNFFFNLTACLVFGVFIFVGYRALFDEFMLARYRTDYGIAFQYFSDMVAPLRSMIYLLIASDLFLIFSHSKGNEVMEEKVVIEEEKVVEDEPKKRAGRPKKVA